MKDYDIVALFPVGYPAEDAKPTPKHTQSKDKDILIKKL